MTKTGGSNRRDPNQIDLTNTKGFRHSRKWYVSVDDFAVTNWDAAEKWSTLVVSHLFNSFRIPQWPSHLRQIVLANHNRKF